jgi:hypothetical protein
MTVLRDMDATLTDTTVAPKSERRGRNSSHGLVKAKRNRKRELTSRFLIKLGGYKLGEIAAKISKNIGLGNSLAKLFKNV